MTWNHRVIRYHFPEAIEEEKELLEVHEVYYKKDGSLHNIS